MRGILGCFGVLAMIAALAGCTATGATGVVERANEVTMKGKPVTLEGMSPKAGERARGFAAVANDLTEWDFNPGDGKVWILSAVPQPRYRRLQPRDQALQR